MSWVPLGGETQDKCGSWLHPTGVVLVFLGVEWLALPHFSFFTAGVYHTLICRCNERRIHVRFVYSKYPFEISLASCSAFWCLRWSRILCVHAPAAAFLTAKKYVIASQFATGKRSFQGLGSFTPKSGVLMGQVVKLFALPFYDSMLVFIWG